MDDIFQLAGVAWPRVPANQYIDRLRAQCGILQSKPLPINSEKELRQGQNVTRPFAQRRNMQRGNLEPVIKIFAETSRGNRILQIHVGGSYHANVNNNRTSRTQPNYLALLQHSEQLHLHGERQISDLIQK